MRETGAKQAPLHMRLDRPLSGQLIRPTMETITHYKAVSFGDLSRKVDITILLPTATRRVLAKGRASNIPAIKTDVTDKIYRSKAQRAERRIMEGY